MNTVFSRLPFCSKFVGLLLTSEPALAYHFLLLTISLILAIILLVTFNYFLKFRLIFTEDQCSIYYQVHRFRRVA